VTAAAVPIGGYRCAADPRRNFPGELGDSYQAACASLGVDPIDAGYGLVLVQDRDGARWTQITTDAADVASAQAIWNSGLISATDPRSAAWWSNGHRGW